MKNTRHLILLHFIFLALLKFCQGFQRYYPLHDVNPDRLKEAQLYILYSCEGVSGRNFVRVWIGCDNFTIDENLRGELAFGIVFNMEVVYSSIASKIGKNLSAITIYSAVVISLHFSMNNFLLRSFFPDPRFQIEPFMDVTPQFFAKVNQADQEKWKSEHPYFCNALYVAMRPFEQLNVL